MSKPMPQAPPEGDHVDHVLQEWRRLGGKRDLSPVAVVARLGRAASLLDRGLNENFARFGLNRNGRTLVGRIGPSHLATEERLLAALTRSEREQLAGLLRKLLISLEEQPTEPPTHERTGGARRASSQRRYKTAAAVPRRRVREG